MNGFIKTPLVIHEIKEGLYPMHGFASSDYIGQMMAEADSCNKEWFEELLKDKNIVGFCLQDADIEEDFEDVKNIAPIMAFDDNTLMIVIECCNLSNYLDDGQKKLAEIFGEFGFKEFEGVYETKIVFQRGLIDGAGE